MNFICIWLLVISVQVTIRFWNLHWFWWTILIKFLKNLVAFWSDLSFLKEFYLNLRQTSNKQVYVDQRGPKRKTFFVFPNFCVFQTFILIELFKNKSRTMHKKPKSFVQIFSKNFRGTLELFQNAPADTGNKDKFTRTILPTEIEIFQLLNDAREWNKISLAPRILLMLQ